MAYGTNILCSANHSTNKDVSSCVCTQVFVLLSEGYKLQSVKVLHLLTSLSSFLKFDHKFDHQSDHKFDHK